MEGTWSVERNVRTRLAGSLTLALVACTAGESGDAPEEQRGESPGAESEVSRPAVTVPAGRALFFRVEETISTGSHAVGDVFLATLAGDVRAEDGGVALYAGTVSRWVVIGAREGDPDEAVLAFRLGSVEVDGEALPLEATVTGAEIRTEPGDSRTGSAAEVAVGADAGAVIGQILGEDTGPSLEGAGVGAAVGTLVAITSRGGEARLVRSSIITVRLDRPLELAWVVAGAGTAAVPRA